MSILATDSFTRADAQNPGANWLLIKGIGVSNDFGIFSNAVDVTTAFTRNADAYDGGIVWPNDQYAKAKCLVMPTSGELWAVVVRSEAVVGTQRNWYAAGTNPADFGNAQTHIWKEVANVFTDLGTTGAVDISAGDTVTIEIVGSTITCKVNGVQKLQVTDSSIPSGKPGIFVQYATINTAVADDFEGGDFGVGGNPVALFANNTLAKLTVS